MPAACLALAALAIVGIQVWRRVTKAPPVQESPDSRRIPLRAAYTALGVGIATALIARASPGRPVGPSLVRWNRSTPPCSPDVTPEWREAWAERLDADPRRRGQTAI